MQSYWIINMKDGGMILAATIGVAGWAPTQEAMARFSDEELNISTPNWLEYTCLHREGSGIANVANINSIQVYEKEMN